MDLLVFLIAFVFVTALILALNHYRMLFSGNREQYEKKELIDAKAILEEQWRTIFLKTDATQAYLHYGIAIFAGFLFTFMGGLYRLHYESYLFHSAALPAALYFLLPYLKEQLIDNAEGSNAFLRKLFNDQPVLLLGFGTATAAQTLSVYGLYHAISFLWIIANVILVIGLILYRFANPPEGSNMGFTKGSSGKKKKQADGEK